MGCFLHALKNYANFADRASRKEYWVFFIVSWVILLVLGGLGFWLGLTPLLVVAGIVLLVLLVPSIAIAVRRLHDAGYSGWWYLLVLVPYVGFIVPFIIGFLSPTPGPNQYGDSAPEC